MYKIMISGKTVAELITNTQKFLNDVNAEKNKVVHVSQDLQLPLIATPPVVHDVPVVASPPSQHPGLPPAPVAQAPAQNLGSEKDSHGVPYDERIHSASKAKCKDGSWKTRRGVEPKLVKEIEAQLLSAAPAAQPIAPPPIPTSPFIAPPPIPVVPPPVVASPPPVPNGFSNNPQPVPPVVGVVAQAPVSLVPPLPPQQVTLAHSLLTFKANLVNVLAELVKQEKLTKEYIDQLKTYFKVGEIWELNEEQINTMFENFCTGGLLTKVQ